ncbi:hypothetical protein SDC9_14776 [bioreactor metagenome]|uniref:Uncharacterized protein n=1 Tax=bioreactor metagenome TaxID=1076179 RepID=A0A644TQ16_9ZZZZ|nr:hypothetical protein [Negativicutes bacterium]
MDMPVVMPASFVDSIKEWTTTAKIADVSGFVSTMQETWDLQTFENLEQGRVAVPDYVINEYLASSIDGSEQVKELKITSLEDNKLRITALTSKAGHVVLVCKVEQFEHDKNHSVIKFKALDKKLPDKPLLSWIFSKVSLAMVTKITGSINPGDGMTLFIRGNEATLDFHQALSSSKIGQAKAFGYKPIDYLVISEAIPENGYVIFKTSLDLPDNVRNMVKNALNAVT